MGKRSYSVINAAGAHSNAICLSLAETAKANGMDFYQYLVKLMTDLPNLSFHKQPEILDYYLPLRCAFFILRAYVVKIYYIHY